VRELLVQKPALGHGRPYFTNTNSRSAPTRYHADCTQRTLQRLAPKKGWLLVCYEAGPTGYGLYRRLREAAIECQVVAPSLVPTKAGNHVKTDRRDAKSLACFLCSGDLTAIHVPTEADEALRDLERTREDAKQAEQTARQQLGKFLLRHDRRWDGETGGRTLAESSLTRQLNTTSFNTHSPFTKEEAASKAARRFGESLSHP